MKSNQVEEIGKKILAKYPGLRKKAKKIYQYASVTLSNNNTNTEGNLIKLTPTNDYEYFFGYYDKIPWDASDRFLLSLKVIETTSSPAPKSKAKIVLIDTNSGNETELANTNTWNSQQGCMLQWLGPDYKTKIIFNDFRNEKYVSVIYNVQKRKEERILSAPVYEVTKDGKEAYSLDFSRLHRLRPGYGYNNLEDETVNEGIPNKTVLWKINLENGEKTEILRYSDLVNFETRPEMIGAEHKINHVMSRPDGKRLMLLHRWYLKGKKFSRLVTLDSNGENLYNLNDDNFNSHAYWVDNKKILIFANKKNYGKGYYELIDKSKEFTKIWDELPTDGHMSINSNKEVVTDTYPNRKRRASVYIIKNNIVKEVASVYAPFKYDNDVRCDLHPRWNRSGSKVCIDSTHEGKRAIYSIENNII